SAQGPGNYRGACRATCRVPGNGGLSPGRYSARHGRHSNHYWSWTFGGVPDHDFSSLKEIRFRSSSNWFADVHHRQFRRGNSPVAGRVFLYPGGQSENRVTNAFGWWTFDAGPLSASLWERPHDSDLIQGNTHPS